MVGGGQRFTFNMEKQTCSCNIWELVGDRNLASVPKPIEVVNIDPTRAVFNLNNSISFSNRMYKSYYCFATRWLIWFDFKKSINRK